MKKSDKWRENIRVIIYGNVMVFWLVFSVMGMAAQVALGREWGEGIVGLIGAATLGFCTWFIWIKILGERCCVKFVEGFALTEEYEEGEEGFEEGFEEAMQALKDSRKRNIVVEVMYMENKPAVVRVYKKKGEK